MKHSVLILSLLLVGCSSQNTPINIGNSEVLTITDCEKLQIDRQNTENKIENLKNQIHYKNVSNTLEQAAHILGGGFKFEFGETENDRNKKYLEAYTERQTLLNKQISLHCK
ncbi:hypothetical protein F480_04425 [Bibersteinia trehalosi Y31]|uniref:Lipoprotein n=1 Tax=Bibersteinia trehalosi Y31 TaxID=1261658 RepID=A0A179D1R9_BIBTR|nr:hypothetical protein [Bibersteinia trehalosi]OAQ15840.1 hypothetical protein F480_04425 [Bibersteinia trehalosi Y31]